MVAAVFILAASPCRLAWQEPEIGQESRAFPANLPFRRRNVAGDEFIRIQFLETCGQYGVSVFNYSPEELEQEIRADIETLRKVGA